MNKNQSLIIIKPDGIVKGLIGIIYQTLLQYGLSVTEVVRQQLPRNWVEKLYANEQHEVYYEEVVSWVSSAPVLLLKVEGEEAVEKAKWKIIGRYPHGIRGQYSENCIKNVAHTPIDAEAAERELNLALPIFEQQRERDKQRFGGKMVFALTGMSECGKSTVGKYLDSRGVPRLKIVKLFERVRNTISPTVDLQTFVKTEEQHDQFALWDRFIDQLTGEMDNRQVPMASIESLYGGGFGPYLKYRLGVHFDIVFIDIPLELRVERQMHREKLATIDEARAMIIPRDEIKAASGISELKSLAGEIIDNSGSLEELFTNVDAMVARHRNKLN